MESGSNDPFLVLCELIMTYMCSLISCFHSVSTKEYWLSHKSFKKRTFKRNVTKNYHWVAWRTIWIHGFMFYYVHRTTASSRDPSKNRFSVWISLVELCGRFFEETNVLVTSGVKRLVLGISCSHISKGLPFTVLEMNTLLLSGP